MKRFNNISDEVKAITITILIIVGLCGAFVVQGAIKQHNQKEKQLVMLEHKMDSILCVCNFVERTSVIPKREDVHGFGTLKDINEVVQCYKSAYEFAKDSIISNFANNKIPPSLKEKYDNIRYSYKNYDMYEFDLVRDAVVYDLIIKPAAREWWSINKIEREMNKKNKETEELREKKNREVWSKI